MRVTETPTLEEYAVDERFSSKKPFRRGSRKQSCGDNIYFRQAPGADWCQRDSFHSYENGCRHPKHVARDTSVNRVLISNDFVYFGGFGPVFPHYLRDQNGKTLCKSGIGQSRFYDPNLIEKLAKWIDSLGMRGYQGAPQEWVSLRATANAG